MASTATAQPARVSGFGADPGVTLAAERDVPAVEAFVEARPEASIYHRSAFGRVVGADGGPPVTTFIARRGPGGAISGILPVALTRSVIFGTFATSLPFVNYGGVLAADPLSARALTDAAWAWAAARGARSLILRHGPDRPLDLPASHHKETLTLSLPAGGVEALWGSIGSKTRNLVRKAERAGFSADLPTGPRAVRAFHDVYAENMSQLGSPGLGPAFFHALLAELPDAVRVHVVRRGRRAAAAAITIRFRDRTEVPWAACLGDDKPRGANMLLYWEILRHATESGSRLFDFGRSTPGSGPHRFKLQWGARPEPLAWYYLSRDGRNPTGELAPGNPRFDLAVRLWRRLPVGLTRVVGAYVAASLP